MPLSFRSFRPGRLAQLAGAALLAVTAAWLAGCAAPTPPAPSQRPEDVKAQIASLIPASVPDRAGWATDIYAAFATLQVPPSPEHICAVLAIAAQESSFRADPSVPRLPEIAWAEIHRRSDRMGVPRLLVDGALRIGSPNGRSYAERIDTARTEKDLSDTFEDLIGSVPMGSRLFAGYNPVRTGGPMQVSIAFAERQAAKGYPYPVARSIRREVFTRRGGVYFGVAHLLDYPAGYDKLIYRFADFNAGRYASRNAAFQNAVTIASGVPITLDGDLVRPDAGDGKPGETELAARTLGPRLELSQAAIRHDLEQGETAAFDDTPLARRVFRFADAANQRPVPRALVPHIALEGPKISRPLSTEWFARRVDERLRACLARVQARADS